MRPAHIAPFRRLLGNASPVLGRHAPTAWALTLLLVSAPTFAAALKTLEDTPVKGSVAVKARKGQTLTYRLATPPAHGDATVDARKGTVTYRGAANYAGTDAFTVEASDGTTATTTEVTVAIAAVNDAPTAAAAVFALDEDARFEGVLAAADIDGDALKYTLVGKAKHGEAAVDPATGAVSFVPAKDFNGEDAIAIDVSDGKLKATAKVTFRVAAVNDGPVVAALGLATAEDSTVSGALKASDVDSENLTFAIAAPPAHGDATVDAWTGAVSYRPAPNFNGPDAFAVEVSDGALSARAEVAVSVAAVNDAPIARSAAAAVDEDAALDGTLVAADVDGDVLTWKLGRKPKHGTLEANGPAYRYVPAPDFHGADSFTFEVSDGRLKSATAVVSLEVKSVNDAPVAGPVSLSTDEDVAAVGNVVATDVDGDPLTYRISQPAHQGEAAVDARTGAVTYRPAPNANGADTFAIEASDGKLTATAQVAVAIAPVYDAPIARPATLDTAEDTRADAQLPGSDPDGEPLTFHLLSKPRLGAVELLDPATGAVRFTPSADLNGDDEVAFDVTDGTTTVKGALKLRVAAVNDAPTLAGLQLKTDEDLAVEAVLPGKDIDGDALTYAVAAQPKQGACAVVDGARVRFVPGKDFNGAAQCAVTVSDGKLKSEPAVVAIAIAPVNDAPVALAASVKTDEDTPLAGKVAGKDIDGDPLVYEIARAPAHGRLVLTDETKGTYLYTPAPDYFGADSFAFTATDPARTTSEATVQIAVAPVDDVPEAVAEAISVPFRGTVTGRLHGFDREGKSLRYQITGQPQHGRVKLVDEQTGDFVVSTDGARDEQRFTFVVSDGANTSAPAELVLRIQNL